MLTAVVGLAMVLIGSLLAPQNASADDPPIITLNSGTSRSFSPGLDDENDDTIGISYCISQAGNVTVTIKNGAGTVVATLIANESQYASCWGTSWDGQRTSGGIAPAGEYTVAAKITNGNGDGNDAKPIQIDNTAPGSITSPAANATLTGNAVIVATPTSGVNVQGMSAYISDGCPGVTMTLEGDGKYRGTIDTSHCPSGPRTLQVVITWLDGYGEYHSFYTPTRNVTVAGNQSAPTFTKNMADDLVVTKSGPAAADIAPINLYYTCADQQSAQVTISIRTTGGATVRSFSAADVAAANGNFECGANHLDYRNLVGMNWDGTRNDGTAVPNGDYVARATATNPGGLSTVVDSNVHVDRRIPASQLPAAGASLDGPTTFTVKSENGIQLAYANILTPGNNYCVNTTAYPASPGDDILVNTDVTSCPSGTQTFFTGVVWYDAYGAGHGYNFTTDYVVADNDAPVITQWSTSLPVVTRASASTVSAASVTLRCVDGTSAVVKAAISNAGGTKVKDLDPPSDYNCAANNPNYQYFNISWDGTDNANAPLPNGTYTLTVTAKDPSGREGTYTESWTVDRRIPATQESPSTTGGVSGVVTFDIKPTGTTQISQIYIGLNSDPGCTWSGNYYTYVVPDSDGHVRYQYDTAQCSAGTHSLQSYVYWTDAAYPNNTFTYEQPLTFVVQNGTPTLELLNPSSSDNQTVVLSTPTDRAAISVPFRCFNGNPATVSAAVTNSAGSVVKNFTASDLGSPNCASTTGAGQFTVNWDGSNNAGQAVPDGVYTITAKMVDNNTGQSLTAPATAHVLLRAPSVLNPPAAGGTLAGTQPFVQTPNSGFTLTGVSFSLHGTSFQVFNAGQDGTWSTTRRMGSYPAGPTTLYSTVTWTDPRGTSHAFSEARDVTIDPDAIALAISAAPTEGAAPLATTLTVNTSDPNGRQLTGTVSWGDGASAPLTAIDPYPTQTFQHTYATPGSYVITVTVQNDLGAVASRSVPINVTTTTPTTDTPPTTPTTETPPTTPTTETPPTTPTTETPPTTPTTETPPTSAGKQKSFLSAQAAIIDLTNSRVVTLTAAARLTTANGSPIVGRKIRFTTNALQGFLCDAITDSTGFASCESIVTAVQTAVNFSYEANFYGDNVYLPSKGGAAIISFADLAVPMP